MSKVDIIRAWKDDDYCESLSPEQRSSLPGNPAGIVELTDHDISQVEGGTISVTLGCYSLITICDSFITFCPIWPITITVTVTAEI